MSAIQPTPVDFATAPRIIMKAGASRELAPLLLGMGVRRPFVVTDAGIAGAGLLAPVLEQLAAAGLAATVFDAVEADPSEGTVIAAADAAKAAGCDGVLGLGGGSPMDVAKLVACLAIGTQPITALYGIEQVTEARLPLALVPTTSGTGSEVTPIAIVTTPQQEKKGVVSRRIIADLAVLDPELTLGLPAHITAATGIDAMVHAIEAYTSRHRKNPLSDLLARQALRLLYAALPKVLADGRDLAARADMLLGSCLAGMAFANAPVAAVHALAYPLGSHFHLPHGLSNALVLLPVLEINMPAAQRLYAELASEVCAAEGDEAARAGQFVAAMGRMLALSGLPRSLRAAGVPEGQIDLLSMEAMKQTRLLVNNPVELTLADVKALYKRADAGQN
ncbi:iron-containing alcohol dehydrogenase [Xanthobacteraceae bacterium A53D]